MIVLPESEKIEDIASGDATSKENGTEYWHIGGEADSNVCYVKPIKKGVETDLQIITRSHHTYSFILREVSSDGGIANIKVFIRLKEPAPVAKPADVVCDRHLESEIEKVGEASQSAQKAMQDQISSLQQEMESRVDPKEFLGSITNDYKIPHKMKVSPFNVTAVYHDKEFTYIKASPGEKPTFSAVKDGKPEMVNFTFDKGIYTIPGVIEIGELKVGKQAAQFQRRTQ
jgi:hypothetical protein